MGGRGASSVSRLSGGGRLDPSSIVSTTSFISERGKLQEEVDQVLEVFRDFENMYGYDVYDIQIAKLKGADAMGALAYYDGANIAFNSNFVNADKMEKWIYKIKKNKFEDQVVSVSKFNEQAGGNGQVAQKIVNK